MAIFSSQKLSSPASHAPPLVRRAGMKLEHEVRGGKSRQPVEHDLVMRHGVPRQSMEPTRRGAEFKLLREQQTLEISAMDPVYIQLLSGCLHNFAIGIIGAPPGLELGCKQNDFAMRSSQDPAFIQNLSSCLHTFGSDDGDGSTLSPCGDESSSCGEEADRYQTLDFDNLPSPFSEAVPVVPGGSDLVPELQLVAQQPAHVSAVLMKDEERSARRTSNTGETKLKTTVIFRNVPIRYTRDMFVAMLDAHGFFGKYDFLYLPFDGSTDVNLGFASVNFVTHDDACDVMRYFSGFRAWSVATSKVCAVEWSKHVQGKAKLIGKFRNSSIMHASVPDHRKPIIFRGGVRSEFPRPHAPVKQPNFAMWSEHRE